MDLKQLADSNRWFQITVPAFPKLSMHGKHPSGAPPVGAVYFKKTNTSLPEQRWQIFPAEDNTYVLRSAAANGGALLSVYFNSTRETELGGTRAMTKSSDRLSEQDYWKLDPFPNGCFALKNVANGSAWNLFAKENAHIAMTSNIEGQQETQMFNFTRLGEINDSSYSSIPSPADPSLPAITNTGSSQPEPSDLDSSSGGLSTGAAVGIGVGAGGAAIIALVLGFFFLFRRRRQRQSTQASADLASEKAGLNPGSYGHNYPDPSPHHSMNKDAYYGYNQPQAPLFAQPLAHDTYTHASMGPQELDTQHVIAEADTSQASQVNELGAGGQMSPVELAGEASGGNDPIISGPIANSADHASSK